MKSLKIFLFLILTNYAMLAGENTIAELKFDEPNSPGRIACMKNAKAFIHGSPEFAQGISGKCLKLKGGSVKEKKEHDYLEIPHNDKLDAKGGSFTVECWIKADDVSYYQFVGKRETVRKIYNTKGWALGMGKNGFLRFILDDGKGKSSKSYAEIHFLKTNWQFDDWNYLVGVRDSEKKELRLYVNGQEVAKAPDKTDNVSTPCSLRIGYDQSCGTFMDGLIDEIKLTRKAVSPAYVSDNFSFDLNLQPKPKRISYDKEVEALEMPVYLLEPEIDSIVHKTTFNMLFNDLKKMLGKNVVALKKGEVPSKGTLIKLGAGKSNLPVEGYELILSNENLKTVNINSNDHGIIYGAIAFSDMLRQSSLFNNGIPALPKNFNIYDYPSISHRISPTGLSKALNASPAKIRKVMEGRARERVNIIQAWTGVPLEKLKNLVDIAAEYGISVSGGVSYLRAKPEGLSPLNEDDVNWVKDMFEKAGKAGCRFFHFYFDDLPGEQFKLLLKDKEHLERYNKKIGFFQSDFIKIMLKTGRKYDVKKYYVCPTPYMRNWEESAKTWWAGRGINYNKYFEELSGSSKLDDLEIYHCDFFPEKLKKLKKKGLKKWAYFLNGLWPTNNRWFTWYMGPTRLSWTWYGFKINEKKGPVPLPEAMQHWRSIAQYTDTVFMGTGGYEGLRIGGIWLWNTEEFNEEKAGEAVCNEIFGAGVYPAMRDYANSMAPLIGYFKAYKTAATAECSPYIEKNTSTTRKDLLNYWRDIKKAETAANDIKKAIIKQKNIFQKPVIPGREHYLAKMDYALNAAKKKLKWKLDKKGIMVYEDNQ